MARSTGDDPFDLERFVGAQDAVYADVLAELRAGAKRSHWIWFIFPQLSDLGRSPTAKHYGIGSLAEARAYLAHPVLGPRLAECARLLLAIPRRPIRSIMPFPDDLKLRSSMTLFSKAAPGEALFRDVLVGYFDGQQDEATLRLLEAPREAG